MRIRSYTYKRGKKTIHVRSHARKNPTKTKWLYAVMVKHERGDEWDYLVDYPFSTRAEAQEAVNEVKYDVYKTKIDKFTN